MPKPASYKLDTTFDGPNIVTHTTYLSDLATGVRLRPVQTTWTTKTLGYGHFGSVVLQEAEGYQLRAVKKLQKGMMGIDAELKVMSKVVKHQALFVVLDGWYENDDFYFISMEYIRGGDLGVYISTTGPVRRAETACDITRQLLEGLTVLHEMKICHRDLKPQNILIASEDPIWVKIADFGISKRSKDTALRTRVGSTAYMAPELMGMLPKELKDETYTNAVDIWSLGCVVHQLLTAEIPFQETAFPGETTDIVGTYNTNGNTRKLVDLVMQQTDFGALKDFCWGKTEFPNDSLRRSEVGDVAASFLKTLLVADPKSRVLAKEALKSNWLLQERDSRDSGGERAVSTRRVREGMKESPTAMATANPPIINHHHAPLETRGYARPAFHRNRYPPIRDPEPPGWELVPVNEPMAMLAKSGTTTEFRTLPGAMRIFRSEIRAAGMAKQEWKVRWAMNLSSSYISILAKFGNDGAVGNMVNVGMLILRDAVENKYPKGLSLIMKGWANALLKACLNGQSLLLENELGLCVQDAKSLIREGRIDDARNLVVGGFELFIQVCRVGDQHLIELVARVWANAVDDSMVTAFGDQILEILAAFSERWVTAVEERDIVEFKALAKAGVELLLAAGRSPFLSLTKQFAAILLSRAQQVLDRTHPDMQGWVIKNLIGWPICDVTIGRQDEEWAQLTVAVGVEFFLVTAQLNRGNQYLALREKLLDSSTTVLGEIVLAGHLQGAKTAIENLVKKKFREIPSVASDPLQDELQANLRGILVSVSNAGHNIPQLRATIDSIKDSICSLPAIDVHPPK